MNTPSSQFSKKDAENLARQFNKVFGHAMMYGIKHQMTLDSTPPFLAVLGEALKNNPLITVTVEHESILLEGSNVDKAVNAKKLVPHFKKAGIQSISFEAGVPPESFGTFLEVVADTKKFPFVDAMKEELSRRKATGVRLNYIVYRKVTTDEEIVNKGMIMGTSTDGTVSMLRPGATGGMSPSDSFSLDKVLRDPKAAAGSLFYVSPSGVPPQPSSVVSNVEMLSNQIKQAAAGGNVPSDSLMEAVMVLREECLGHISDFKTAGLVDKDMDSVVSHVQKLTHETIITLIREEYKNGQISVKRLAQILRRMVPDARELRELLPLLKGALTSVGMPFVKYVELVNELRHELEGDDVVASLAAASREMGVTPDEVIEEIKKHPNDAARLMILASELRRSGGGNEAGFEQVLTDYIEKVSAQMAVGATDPTSAEGGRQLGAVLQKIEANMLDNLKQQGVDQSVLTALSARLTERVPFLLDMAKTEWLKKAMEARPDLDTGMLARLIASTVQQSVDIDTHRDTLYALCQQKGLSPDQISDVLHQATLKVAAATQQMELPRGVLSSSAIMYFLERECKLSLRYHNPFSLLIISILRLQDASGAFRPLSADERTMFTKALITTLRGIMRDIDMIGVPSSATESIVFVILPMTSEEKTYGLVERLRRELAEYIFDAGVFAARLSLALSITGFDAQEMKDKTGLLKVAMAHHRATEKIVTSGIA